MAALDTLLKKYKDIVSSADVVRPKTKISLGPLSVNLAIGDPNGVECGRVVQIVGKQSSGKSTLALDIVAQYQKQHEDALPLYIDFERAFDRDYAFHCGVDLQRLLVVRADTTEQGLTICEDMIKQNVSRLVIIDSIAAAMPSSELQKDYIDSPKMASNAGLITRFCTRIVPILDNYDALVIAINQFRMNFNTMSPEREIPFGGLALAYATSVRLDLTKIKTEDTRITTQIIIKKNKTGAPMKRSEFYIDYNQGINHGHDLLDLAVTLDIVIKAGAWYTYQGVKTQGKDSMVEALMGDPVLLSELRATVLDRYAHDNDR